MDVSSRLPAARRWVALGVCLAAAASGLSARQADAPLRAGAVVERPLKLGEGHYFKVGISAGDYVAITVDQRGIDVRPVILDPSGKIVYQYDFGEWGDEPAAIVAATAGRYRLEIRTEPESPPAGTYRLRVDAVRPATPPDEVRAR